MKTLSKESIEHICNHPNLYNWLDICMDYYIVDYIDIFKQYIDQYNLWIEFSVYQTLSEEIIEKYSDKLNWVYISSYQDLSEEFIQKYHDKVSWIDISKWQKLSDKFIVNNFCTLHVIALLHNQNISEDTKTYIRMFI